MQEISDFSFIINHSMSFVGNHLMKLLKLLIRPRLGGDSWVVPKPDSFRLAVEMTVKAFDAIDVTAVALSYWAVSYSRPG